MVMRIVLVITTVLAIIGMIVTGAVAMAASTFVLFDILTGILRHTHGNTVAVGAWVQESYATTKMFAPLIAGLLAEAFAFLLLSFYATRLRNQTH